MLNAKKTGHDFYNIETLAKKTGLTRRTIHYYVQRGLLSPPEGGGRGHYYTEEHIQRIKTIQRWRAQGVPLEKMKQMLSNEGISSTPQLPETALQEFQKNPLHQYAELRFDSDERPLEEKKTSHWMRLAIRNDVELHFTPGALSQEDLEAIEQFILLRMKP